MRCKCLGKICLECGTKMVLRCGKEVKERQFSKTFRKHTFLKKKPINVVVDMKTGEDNLGTEKGVCTEYTKPILFSTLTVDSQISYSWDLKTILFENKPPKTQDSQVFSLVFLLIFLISSQIFYTKKKNLNPLTCMEKDVKFLNKMKE